ncbi:MAG: transposase [Elusimicrobiota bacterium]
MRFYLDNTYYFITCATREHYTLFNTNEKKQILLNQINKVEKNLKIPVLSYGILANHYHILFHLLEGKKLKKAMQTINGGSSYLLNQLTGIYRSVWDKYFAKIITTEQMFYKIIGYIAGNPLKHSEVNNFEELKSYQFSNYYQLCYIYGEKTAKALVQSTIVVDEADNFKPDFSRLKEAQLTPDFSWLKEV